MALAHKVSRLLQLTRKAFQVLRVHGPREVWLRLKKKIFQKMARYGYWVWTTLFDRLSRKDRAAIRERINTFQRKPTFSVVLPVYNTPEKWLKAAIESVRAQIYPHWQLCIADDASTAPHVKVLLERYQKIDSRISVVFRSSNGHISEATNSALALATGEFIAFMDHDDVLRPHALYMIAEELQCTPDADILYSDEDKLGRWGRRFEPHFKPDWNPDLFLSSNYLNHLTVVRTTLAKSIGGLRSEFNGSQDYDFLLRAIEKTDDRKIRHIPFVLYHWRAAKGSVALAINEKNYAVDAAKRAVAEHLKRLNIRAEVREGHTIYNRVVYQLPSESPTVGVVIPTRDRLDLLKQAVTSVFEDTDYPNVHVYIVNNRSEQTETQSYFREIQKNPRVTVLDYDAPFNYAAMNNWAVKQTNTPLVCLLNNDIKAITRSWLSEMVSQALRPEIGAVGAKLLYPNGTVQHAGIVVGIDTVAAHVFRHERGDAPGYASRLQITQNYAAVTAACMVLRREIFDEVGGLDEVNFAIAFNDVDLCLRIREKGYRILYTPFAELFHFESASRGSEDTPENFSRFLTEIGRMFRKWPQVLAHDPCYSPNFSKKVGDFALGFPPAAIKPWRSRAEQEAFTKVEAPAPSL